MGIKCLPIANTPKFTVSLEELGLISDSFSYPKYG